MSKLHNKHNVHLGVTGTNESPTWWHKNNDKWRELPGDLHDVFEAKHADAYVKLTIKNRNPTDGAAISVYVGDPAAVVSLAAKSSNTWELSGPEQGGKISCKVGTPGDDPVFSIKWEKGTDP